MQKSPDAPACARSGRDRARFRQRRPRAQVAPARAAHRLGAHACGQGAGGARAHAPAPASASVGQRHPALRVARLLGLDAAQSAAGARKRRVAGLDRNALPPARIPRGNRLLGQGRADFAGTAQGGGVQRALDRPDRGRWRHAGSFGDDVGRGAAGPAPAPHPRRTSRRVAVVGRALCQHAATPAVCGSIHHHRFRRGAARPRPCAPACVCLAGGVRARIESDVRLLTSHFTTHVSLQENTSCISNPAS